jgi:hypothetical protein
MNDRKERYAERAGLAGSGMAGLEQAGWRAAVRSSRGVRPVLTFPDAPPGTVKLPELAFLGLSKTAPGTAGCSATIWMEAALPRLKCSRRLTRCLT